MASQNIQETDDFVESEDVESDDVDSDSVDADNGDLEFEGVAEVDEDLELDADDSGDADTDVVEAADTATVEVEDDDTDDVEIEDDDEEAEESLEVLLARDDDADGHLDGDARDGLSATVSVINPDEFTCRSCFLVKRRAQLADSRSMICLDCA